MIFTIGHRANYLAAIQREGVIQKTGRSEPCEQFPDGYSGGYAFRTLADAQRRIVEEDKVGSWSVFGMDADWEQDTEPASDGWWHNLIRHADIIVLEGIT